MKIIRTSLAALVIAVLVAVTAHAQQWDTSKLQKNKQTNASGPSSGMKFPYTVSTPSVAMQQQAVPAPAVPQQWDPSKMQKNMQTPVTGRYGDYDFPYAPVAPSTTTEEATTSTSTAVIGIIPEAPSEGTEGGK